MLKSLESKGAVAFTLQSSAFEAAFSVLLFGMPLYDRRNPVHPLMQRAKNVSDVLTIKRQRAALWQVSTLRKMIFKARQTEFGKQHGFERILIQPDVVAAFQKQVPLSDYNRMHPWWMREFQGEPNVTWPGRAQYFALSSGTTTGSSKYIPVTQAQLKAIYRAGTRQLLSIARTDVPKDFFTKNYLTIGGSTDLEYNGVAYSGDLSGITTRNAPFWFDRLARPTPEIKRQKDWAQKMDIMVKEAPNWDVAMIAGGPAWVKMLLTRIVEHYKLDNIHALWPHFSVYSWGAVALDPYKADIDALLGRPIKYFETYLASEGFIAYQNREESQGMTLAFRNQMFFEFVPFHSDNFDENGDLRPGAEVLTIAKVQEGVEYAILITTCAGAWRYAIGDTVRFVNVDACEIKITGRIKHHLSICGEHLSVDNMNQALGQVAQEMGLRFPEFTVKGFSRNGQFGHIWHLACNQEANVNEIKTRLDAALSRVNDDYAVERKHVLTEMEVQVLPESLFLDFMDYRGKIGGQSKFPRVMTDALHQEWSNFVALRKP